MPEGGKIQLSASRAAAKNNTPTFQIRFQPTGQLKPRIPPPLGKGFIQSQQGACPCLTVNLTRAVRILVSIPRRRAAQKPHSPYIQA